MPSNGTKSKSSVRKVVRKRSSTTSLCFKRLFIARPDVLHQYLHHQNINQYLDYLNQRYPTFVEVYTLGHSYEGRPLKAIEIDWRNEKNIEKTGVKYTSMTATTATAKATATATTSTATSTATTTRLTTTNSAPTKLGSTKSLSSRKSIELTAKGERNVIFIEGGTHGREWITISVALNVIHQLTEKHMRNTAILKRFRFIIVPISNPDGYEYTLDKNLRWRKNRRPTSASCKHYGVDCNRNYDFHWDKGSAKVSCCTYKGEKPFSESETRALSKTLQTLSPDILLFISLHSYAQAIMYPWGCSREPAQNVKELETVATAGMYAIKSFSGRHYRTGSITKLSASIIGGSIVDYAYGVIKVPYAYVMELPDSSYGFQPPAEVIRPIGEESWIGIREMCYCAQRLYANRQNPPENLLYKKPNTKKSGSSSSGGISGIGGAHGHGLPMPIPVMKPLPHYLRNLSSFETANVL